MRKMRGFARIRYSFCMVKCRLLFGSVVSSDSREWDEEEYTVTQLFALI